MSDDHALLEVDEPSAEVIDRAFGEENRARLLGRYLQTAPLIEPSEAWTHIYRLLLWVNRTIGLAHCYESDKCQPGKPWYPRSLAFHGWVASELETTPAELSSNIDWLFRHASEDLAKIVVGASHLDKVQKQRLPYEGKGFPLPGEDPELIELVLETLGYWLRETPPTEVQRVLVERIQTYVTQENKRKNLIGEGFEDAVAAVLRRVPGLSAGYEILTRPLLHNIGGFNAGPANEKPRQVDLVLRRRSDSLRILITAKWSVRADREEQFMSDFRDYSRLERLGENFNYVLVTNEFDAARLVRACERRRENAELFTDVVHVNPRGPIIAYGNEVKYTRRNASKMYRYVEDGRLSSFEAWAAKLVAQA